MKKFICLLIVPLLVLGTNVYADSVFSDYYEYGTFDVETTSSTADYGFTYYDIITNTRQTYYDSNMTLSFNGKEYTAHCLDPGLSRPTGNITCKPINRNPAVAALGEMTNGGDDAVQTLSYRIWAVLNERTNQDKEQKSFKQTVEAYSQIMTGNEDMMRQTAAKVGLCGNSSNPTCDNVSKEQVANALFGDNVALFQSAWAIATAASELGDYEYDRYEDTQGRVSISSTKQEGTNVTIRLSSGGARIPKEDVQVVCKRGCSVTSFDWSGYGGTINVAVTGSDCKYELEFYYPTEGSYECTSPESNTQTLYTYVDEATTSAAQTYEGSISGEINGTVCETCCTDAPTINPGAIFGDVNNCCWETHSVAYEYALNDLFCKDETLELEWYKTKCNADHGAYKSEINDFCDLYCTERVTVDLPGAVTASSGRYFQLQKNPVGNTTSPYIQGFKRCRVKTDLQYWIDTFQTQLNVQVQAFNEFQRYEAARLSIKTMMGLRKDDPVNIENQAETRTFTITCTAPEAEGERTCKEGEGSTQVTWEDSWYIPEKTETFTVSGKVYNYEIGYVERYTTIKTEGPFDESKDNYYNEWKVVKDKTPRLSHITYSNATASCTKNTEVNATCLYVSDGEWSIPYNTIVTDYEAYNDIMNELEEKLKEYHPGAYFSEYTGDISKGSSSTTAEEEEVCSGADNERTIKQKWNCDISAVTNGSVIPEYSNSVKKFSMNRYIRDEMDELVERAQGKYNAATATAKKLEDELDLCNNYFTRTPATSIYQFNASAGFSYSQTYLDEKGELVRDEIQIPFTSSPGCRVFLAATGKTGETEDDQYSPKYTEDIEDEEEQFIKITDMKEGDLEIVDWYENDKALEPYFDEDYDGYKKMTNDGLLQAICEWNEGTNTIYTLAQTGVATETTQVKNFTIHERQYQVHLTTLEGSFETFWRVRGLGSNGKFDSFFMNYGDTCAARTGANETPASVNSMFTCELQVEHEVVLTGYCNGVVNGNGDVNCDPFKEGYELVNFKVVDPADLFPSVSGSQVPSYEGETYGHNWIIDEEGKEVLGIIEDKGAKDKTYAPENLSYAFTLTPNDMQHIKNYNESRIQYGGYTDFELTCDCPSGSIPIDSKESCSKCKSTFIENLAAGKISYGMGTQDVSGWANGKESLGSVRSGNNW